MYKFSSTDDFNFGEEPLRICTDIRDLKKIASCSDELKVERTPNQTDVHVIALGAHEGTGVNRNGDTFPEEECIAHYKTFVNSGKRNTEGKWDGRALNRHHKNKPEDPKYGNIKAATYNHKMKRIELIVGLDNDKCAEEIQKIAKGETFNVSMAAKVAGDVCSWCGHFAKDEKHRCKHIPRNLNEITKQGEVCAMINKRPRWFELSIVGRPADRIGMGLKMASEYTPKMTADYLKIYTGFVPPVEDSNTILISKHASDKRYLIGKLAEMEKRIEAIAKAGPKDSKEKFIAEHKTKLRNSEEISQDAMDELRKLEPTKLLKVLADHGIVFSVEDFMKYIFGDKLSSSSGKVVVNKVRTRLPKMFSHLLEDADDMGEVVNSEKFDPANTDILPKEIRGIIKGLFNSHSIFEEPVRHRIMHITIVGKPHKSHGEEENISKEAAIKELADQYTAYKLAALRYMYENGKLTDDVITNAIIQNS